MCRKSFLSISLVLMLCLALGDAARGELVGWWAFEEGSGTQIFDSSGYENHGTVFDDVQWVEGKSGWRCRSRARTHTAKSRLATA